MGVKWGIKDVELEIWKIMYGKECTVKMYGKIEYGLKKVLT